MSEHAQVSIYTGIAVYFADPRSPWQSETNENTNGLLRQYHPKGIGLKPDSADSLNAVAAEFNGGSRKTRRWQTPDEVFAKPLSRSDVKAGVIAATPRTRGGVLRSEATTSWRRPRLRKKFALMEAACANYEINHMASVLSVSCLGFYRWRRTQAQPTSAHQRHADLDEIVLTAHKESNGTCG
jgi:hypothetical protein